MSQFKRLARAAFERIYGGRPGPSGEPERLSMDIELEGAREIVSLRRNGEALSWSCTCAQPECAHARIALGFLAEVDAAVADPSTRRSRPDMPAVTADVRRLAQPDTARGADMRALIEALRDVLTAVARAGLSAGASAAQDEALQRLLRVAPEPLPLGISRWVGRLKQALSTRSLDEAARLLAGASLLIDDLEANPRSAEAQTRVLSWLGALGDDTYGRWRVTDRTLLEIAREELTGLELRYLVDLSDGTAYREERLAGGPTASLGPCPRAVTVWLADTELGAAPQRIRLLQYAVTPLVEAELWEKLVACAVRDFTPLLAGYRAALAAYPGLCEPFALIAPERLEGGSAPWLTDAGGQRLHLAHPDNPASLRFLTRFSAGEPPAFVAGRLIDRDGALSLAPLGAGVMRDGRMVYAQM